MALVKPKVLPSLEYLNECFYLNQDKGVLTWKERPLHHFKNEGYKRATNTRFQGKQVGGMAGDGSIETHLMGKSYAVHRIIWKMINGYDPVDYVDHIKGDNTLNGGKEIRAATNSQNQQNRGKSILNTTGYKGVSFHKRNKSFQANITENGNQHHLGSFKTAGEAHEAYCTAADKYHGEFANYGI